jgi:uracil-DNA glycosylase
MPAEEERVGAAHLWQAKLAAEVKRAESLVPGRRRAVSSAPAYSAVLAVKGRPTETDAVAGRVFGGEDGEALRKALAALGVEGDPFCIASRPSAEADEHLDAVARRIRELAEAVEAELVLALDAVAAGDVAAAFGTEALKPGMPVHLPGHILLATDDFSAALADEAAKRVVWRQMKALVKG